VQVFVAPHQKPPVPGFQPEDLLEESVQPEDISRVRLMITPPDHSVRNAWLSRFFVGLVWLGTSVAVFGGGWIALRLVVNPGSVGWLSWMFPEWSREAERYQQDAPKTLAELTALAEENGQALGQPLLLPSGPSQSGDLLIPVRKCSDTAVCDHIQELRVYHREPAGREARYRLGDRLPVSGPDEFFVTAPLVQVTAMGPGSTRSLPLDTLERLPNAPSERGFWFVVSGVHEPGRDRIRFGYIGWYDGRWQQLRLLLPWTSPVGQLPRWQPITGQPTPELIVDQTIGLEPNFRVYQLAAATPERPVQLMEISLQQTPLQSRTYENALLLARQGLWSPALAMLSSMKASRGGSLEEPSERWPAYAQAQLDVIQLHADFTRQNAERTWANPSQKLMAEVIDGRWERAWAGLMGGLPAENDLLPLLRPEVAPLWQRVAAAARISPDRQAVRQWATLMQYVRQGRGGAIAWLQQQNGATLASHTLDSGSRRILQQIDEALWVPSQQSASANRFYGTATPIPPPDPRNWHQPNGELPDIPQGGQWYRIPITAIYQGQGWQRSPFHDLFSPAPTPRYLWSQLGLEPSADLSLVTWNEAGSPETRQVVVQALRWSNGTLELLASGTLPADASTEPLLAYSRAAFTWQNPQGTTRLQDLALQNPQGAATLAERLRREVSGTASEPPDPEPWGDAPFYDQGDWLADRVDLTGDSQPEIFLNVPPTASTPARTLIFSPDGTLLYSELGGNTGQQIMAIATVPDTSLPFLLTRQNDRYHLRQWSAQEQRFE